MRSRERAEDKREQEPKDEPDREPKPEDFLVTLTEGIDADETTKKRPEKAPDTKSEDAEKTRTAP